MKEYEAAVAKGHRILQKRLLAIRKKEEEETQQAEAAAAIAAMEADANMDAEGNLIGGDASGPKSPWARARRDSTKFDDSTGLITQKLSTAANRARARTK